MPSQPYPAIRTSNTSSAHFRANSRAQRDTFPHNARHSRDMNDPIDASGMPLRGTSSAPHFSGDYTQVVNFLESVERLAQPLGLSDEVMIKYALKYTAAPQRQLLSYFEGDNYVEFADYVLDFYLECGIDHYTRPIIAKPAAREAPLASAPPEPERALVQREIATLAHLSAPPETKVPVACAPQVSNCEPHQPSDTPITPPSEIRDPTALPEAPLEDIISPLVSDDLKNLSHISAPIPELPTTLEAQNATLPMVRDDLKHPAHQNAMAAMVRDDLKHLSHISAPIPGLPMTSEAQNAMLPAVRDDLEHPSHQAATAAMVSDDLKHLSHISAPIPELPSTSEAQNATLPVVRDDLKHPAHQNAMPAMVSDDLKHQSHFSALIPEPSAVSEVHYAMPSHQSMSLHYPLVADDSALFAFSAYNDYHPPVKHPCIMPPMHELDHASDNPEAPSERYIAPSIAQIAHIEALYIHPRIFSRFSSLSCLRLSRSHLPVAAFLPKDCQIILDHAIQISHPLPVRSIRACNTVNFRYFRVLSHFHVFDFTPFTFISHHFAHNSSFTRRIRAPRALIPALNALTVAEEFSCYRVFTVSSVFSCISLIQNQPHFNFASMRTSRAHLAYTYTPSSFMIVLDLAFFTLIRIFRDSTYHVDIILVHPNKGFPFMSSRNIAFDLQLIRCSRIISAPNFTYHLSPVHILTIYPPILAYSEDIAINTPKRDYARSSRAHHRLVEHPNAPYVTPLGHAFNLYRKVQEFIPPVTSPPTSHV
ncbi:hypothetical protein BD769DRAFT_1664080 [Suillus cothurnatus]|nr:hypothetical protein BD769DRAFT_1664080 [Suillus cothurnatus]